MRQHVAPIKIATLDEDSGLLFVLIFGRVMGLGWEEFSSDGRF